MAPHPAQKVEARSRPFWWTKWCSRFRYWERNAGSPGDSSYEPMTAEVSGSAENTAATAATRSFGTSMSESMKSSRSASVVCAPRLRALAGPLRFSSCTTVAPIPAAKDEAVSFGPSITTTISAGPGSRRARLRAHRPHDGAWPPTGTTTATSAGSRS